MGLALRDLDSGTAWDNLGIQEPPERSGYGWMAIVTYLLLGVCGGEHATSMEAGLVKRDHCVRRRSSGDQKIHTNGE